jgi:hypothetical protein
MVSNFYTLSPAPVELRCEEEHFAAEPTIRPIEVVPEPKGSLKNKKSVYILQTRIGEILINKH